MLLGHFSPQYLTPGHPSKPRADPGRLPGFCFFFLPPRRANPSPPRKVPRTRHFFLWRLRKLQRERSILPTLLGSAQPGRPSPPHGGGRGGGGGGGGGPGSARGAFAGRPPENGAALRRGRHGGRGDAARLHAAGPRRGRCRGTPGGRPGSVCSLPPPPPGSLPPFVSPRRPEERWRSGRCPWAACWCTRARCWGRAGTR